MKTIVEKPIGGDGGKAGLYLEGADLALKVTYPLEKIVQPAIDVIDKALDKLEQAIPGDWDKAVVEKIKAEAKEQLLKVLSE